MSHLLEQAESLLETLQVAGDAKGASVVAALVLVLTDRTLLQVSQEQRIRELDARVRALEASVSPRVIS